MNGTETSLPSSLQMKEEMGEEEAMAAVVLCKWGGQREERCSKARWMSSNVGILQTAATSGASSLPIR